MQIARNYLHRTIRRVFLLARIMPLPVVAPTGEDHTPSILFPFPVNRNSLSFHNFSSSRIIGAITIYGGKCVIGVCAVGAAAGAESKFIIRAAAYRNLIYSVLYVKLLLISVSFLSFFFFFRFAISKARRIRNGISFRWRRINRRTRSLINYFFDDTRPSFRFVRNGTEGSCE